MRILCVREQTQLFTKPAVQIRRPPTRMSDMSSKSRANQSGTEATKEVGASKLLLGLDFGSKEPQFLRDDNMGAHLKCLPPLSPN